MTNGHESNFATMRKSKKENSGEHCEGGARMAHGPADVAHANGMGGSYCVDEHELMLRD